MKYAWKIYAGKQYVASGSIDAASEREALDMVLIEQAEGRDADTSYSITVGDSTASSYGDEFLETAGASSIDDTQWTPPGETVYDGRLVDPDTDVIYLNGDVIDGGVAEGYIQIRSVDWTLPEDTAGVGETTEEAAERMVAATGFNPADFMEAVDIVHGVAVQDESEYSVRKTTLNSLVQRTAPKSGRQMIRRILNTFPADTKHSSSYVQTLLGHVRVRVCLDPSQKEWTDTDILQLLDQ